MKKPARRSKTAKSRPPATDPHVEALRHLRHYIPSLEEETLFQIMGMKAASFVREKRQRMERERPAHWTVRLARKLDRLTFPELTAGKEPSEAQRLARLVASMRSKRQLDARSAGSLHVRLSERLMRSVWSMDGPFLEDFGRALTAANTPLARAYHFMLWHAQDVEACKSRADILRLDGFPLSKWNRGSFYRLLREIGLQK